jgi:hypothetical protein
MEETLKIGIDVANVQPLEGCIIVEAHNADARYKGIREAIEKRNLENDETLPEEVPKYETFMVEWCAKGYPVSVLSKSSKFYIGDVVVLRNYTPMSVIRLDRNDNDELVPEDDDDFVFLVREADVIAKING